MAQEVDDEEFLEIAIAMSLQDQENAENVNADEIGANLQLHNEDANQAAPGPSRQAM